MKRSGTITLSILATIAIGAGCSQEPAQLSLNREQYKSKEDCLHDWNSEQDCEEIQDQQHNRWHGPRYFYWQGYPYIYHGPDRNPTPVGTAAQFSRIAQGQRSARSIGTTTSMGHLTRGGFGSKGSFHSASS
ncbi:MAG TPA: hypothetical protein VEI46_08740 [Thermodesulfovibrionales bacterium]|nr:hypothetical protein [Thermodesulfovibrionales bacterium]